MRKLAFLIGLLINALILVYYEYNPGTDGIFSTNRVRNIDSGVKDYIRYAGYAQAVLAALMLFMWIVLNLKLTIIRSWRDLSYENRLASTIEELDEDEENAVIGAVPASELSLAEAREKLYLKGPDAEEFTKDGKRNFGHCCLRFEYLMKSTSFLMFNFEFIYLILYLSAVLLGIFVSPVFYSLTLLDVA